MFYEGFEHLAEEGLSREKGQGAVQQREGSRETPPQPESTSKPWQIESPIVNLMPTAPSRHSMNERRLTSLHGLPVVLPDARILGVVHDIVLDENASNCTHLFVVETPEEIVEGSLHVSIPWTWVRSISDVILLRWFPPTPIPRRPDL